MLNHVTPAAVSGFARFLNDFKVVFFRYDCAGGDAHLPALMAAVPTLSVQVRALAALKCRRIDPLHIANPVRLVLFSRVIASSHLESNTL